MIPALTLLIAILAAPSHTHEPDPQEPERGDLVSLRLPYEFPPSFRVEVPFGAEVIELDLTLKSLRSSSFRVKVDDGRGIREEDAPPVRTYRGEVLEWKGSQVAASLLGSGLVAHIVHPDGTSYTLEPVEDSHVGEGLHRLAPSRPDFDVRECESQVPPGGEPLPGATPSMGDGDFTVQGDSNCTKVAEIAFDADYELYVLNGSSVPATIADIESVLNAVDLIYARDVLITYELTAVVVRTAEPDPYDGTAGGVILDQFRNYWNANHTDIPRDMAHLVTGRSLSDVLGLAWVGVVCNLPWAYGLTVFQVSFDSKVGILGHELGHNWSAPHCLDAPCVIMCGACHEIGSRTSQLIMDFRDAVQGCLDDGGQALPPIPPHALHDELSEVDGVVAIDVLQNDVDANCESIEIGAFDAMTRDGGVVERSVGTGPFGRDELVYHPPIGYDGSDHFTYTAVDASGREDVGEVRIEGGLFLVAHYKLDETSGNVAADSAGNDLDGNYMQGPLLGQGGARPGTGTSVWFDGINDRVRVFNDSLLASLSSQCTIASWVRPDATAFARIFGNAGSWVFGLTVNGLRFSLPGVRDYNATVNIPAGEWTHVAATFDSSFDVSFYVNGELVRTVNGSSPANSPSDRWFMATFDNSQDFFQGRIDDTQIYGGGLSADQVRYLYDNPGETLCTKVWTLYGEGHPGTNGVPGIRAQGAARVGESFTLEIDNAAGQLLFSTLVLGVASTDLPLFGGRLLVDPALFLTVLIGVSGAELTFPVPDDLPCLPIYIQAIQPDAGAVGGYAFTPGLHLRIGF